MTETESPVSPGQAFRVALHERWAARRRQVDKRPWETLPEADRDDLETAAQAAIMASGARAVTEQRDAFRHAAQQLATYLRWSLGETPFELRPDINVDAILKGAGIDPAPDASPLVPPPVPQPALEAARDDDLRSSQLEQVRAERDTLSTEMEDVQTALRWEDHQRAGWRFRLQLPMPEELSQVTMIGARCDAAADIADLAAERDDAEAETDRVNRLLVALNGDQNGMRAELAEARRQRDIARDKLAAAQDVVATILGMPETEDGEWSMHLPNSRVAFQRRRAGLAYGTRAEAKAADEAYQRQAGFEATRSETDL